MQLTERYSRLRYRHKFMLKSAMLFLAGIGLVLAGARGNELEELFGSSVLASAGVLAIAGSILAVFGKWLASRGMDKYSIAIALLAAIASLHYLHISSNGLYTNDIDGHINRFRTIAGNWLNPFGYREWQHHHPPLYYFIAALITNVTQVLGGISDVTAVRFFSWVCYLVFNGYGLLVLRRIGFAKGTYYCCAALFLLWPAGFHLASKIGPEPLYYALYAASFYYMLVWYQDRYAHLLRRAIVIAAIAFTVRTSAIILLAYIAAMVLVALVRGRFWIRPHEMKPWLRVGAAFIACVLINLSSYYFTGGDITYHLGIAKLNAEVWLPKELSHFLLLDYDYFVQHPYVSWSADQSFPDYLLKTAIFGEYSWPWPHVASIMSHLVLALAIYSVLPWFYATRSEWRGMMPFALGLAVPLVFHLVFNWLTLNMPSQDARYVYPALVCFVVLFGRSHLFYQRRGNVVLAALGPMLVLALAIISLVFFWMNGVHLRCPTCGTF